MIRLSNIKKTFQGPNGPVEAIKGVDIHVEPGEIFGIVGLSGAGKSTLVRCINMLEKPTSGQVIVDGKDLTAMSESQLREVRKSIAMIFQHFNLAKNKTVYQNIEFVKLSDKADTYPSKLSGGQKQRVSIARALANNTKILFGVLIPEAMPSIIKNITVTAISVLGFSAMAGLVGGGGLGDLAYRYGYQRFQTDIMVVCVFLLVLIVQIIQLTGDAIAVKFDKKH